MKKCLNKSDLAVEIARRGRLTNTMARAILETMLEVISSSLANGEEVKIANFGSFVPRVRKGREGRNPRTGEAVTIPDSTTVKFIPSKSAAK
jgi:DNA-binding protein HU-beta